MKVDALEIVYRTPAELRAYDRNSRTHTEAQIRAIRKSIDAFGFTNPVLLKDDETTIGAGHGRVLAALLEPALERVPTIALYGLTDEQWRAYVIADNRLAEMGAGWNVDALRLELTELGGVGFDLSLSGFESLDALTGLGDVAAGLPSGGGGAASPKSTGAGSLAERFGVPPFSVLNAREGWWQDRKRAWIALGIKSELGRGEGANEAIPGGAGENAAWRRGSPS